MAYRYDELCYQDMNKLVTSLNQKLWSGTGNNLKEYKIVSGSTVALYTYTPPSTYTILSNTQQTLPVCYLKNTALPMEPVYDLAYSEIDFGMLDSFQNGMENTRVQFTDILSSIVTPIIVIFVLIRIFKRALNKI